MIVITLDFYFWNSKNKNNHQYLLSKGFFQIGSVRFHWSIIFTKVTLI